MLTRRLTYGAVSAALVLFALNTGCAARRSDGTLNFHASMTETVLTIEQGYNSALTSLGDARRAGVISQSTLERGRTIGNSVYTALETTKSTLSAYLTGGGGQAPVYAALSALTAVMGNLERFYLKEMGEVVVP